MTTTNPVNMLIKDCQVLQTLYISQSTKNRSLFGYFARLLNETPAKQALNCALKAYKRPMGALKTGTMRR